MNQSLEGLSDLPEAQKNELLSRIEEMQVRDRYDRPSYLRPQGVDIRSQGAFVALVPGSPGSSAFSLATERHSLCGEVFAATRLVVLSPLTCLMAATKDLPLPVEGLNDLRRSY